MDRPAIDRMPLPIPRAAITGVVLTGGRGQRMGGADKGLLPFRGQPLVGHLLAALREVTACQLISANRNLADYETLGCPVIRDAGPAFAGPLAGILATLRSAWTPYVLTVPCDTPLLTGALLKRLLRAASTSGAAIVVAGDGARLHPVIMLAETRLADDLAACLAAGERKVESWMRRHSWATADFSDRPGALANLNTPEDLARLAQDASRATDNPSLEDCP